MTTEPRLWDGAHRALVLGVVGVVAAVAFEAIGVATAMPVASGSPARAGVAQPNRSTALDPFRGYATAQSTQIPAATRVLYGFRVVKLGNTVVDGGPSPGPAADAGSPRVCRGPARPDLAAAAPGS